MTTPAQGNRIPPGCKIGADNGKFGENWEGTGPWWAWLTKTVTRYGADRFLFAVAPDVPFDAAGTLAESLPWLRKIRDLGIPAAFAAQNGSEQPGLIPWDEFEVLFIGGDTEWKEGPAAEALAAEARRRGKQRHMGRVNTDRRLKIAMRFGCDTVDGTTLARAPKNLWPLLEWMRRLHAQGVQEALL